MQFVYALSFLLALATINAYKYNKDVKQFNIDETVSDTNKLTALTGCFLDKQECDPIGSQFRKDVPDAFLTACANCTAEQKGILNKYLKGLKDKLPTEYEALCKKYDPEGKYTAPLLAAINA